MALSDEIVGWFAPEAKQRRLVARAKSDMVQETRRALRASRGYDGARHDRLTRDWRAGGGNADAEINADLPTLRNRSSDLVRNNPYVASAVRQLVANLIGDGIEARAVHSDPVVQALAQKVYLTWAKSKVDGRHDFYGNQRLACFAMIERGDGDLAQRRLRAKGSHLRPRRRRRVLCSRCGPPARARSRAAPTTGGARATAVGARRR